MEDFETTTIVLLPSRSPPYGRIRYMKMSSFERLVANFRSTNQGQLVSKGTSTMDYQESLSHGVVSENAEQASIAVTDKACQTEPPDYPKKMPNAQPPIKPSGTALPVQRTATVEPCLPSSNDTKSSEDAPKEQQDGHRCDVNTVALRILKCQLTRLQRLVSIVKSRRPTEMNIFLLSYVQLLTRLIDNLLDSKREQRVVLQIFESIVASGLARKRLWRVIANPRMPVPADALQYPKENQPKFGESQTPREFNHHHHQKPNTNYRKALCNYVGSDGPTFNDDIAAGTYISTRLEIFKRRHDRSQPQSIFVKRARHELPTNGLNEVSVPFVEFTNSHMRDQRADKENNVRNQREREELGTESDRKSSAQRKPSGFPRPTTDFIHNPGTSRFKRFERAVSKNGRSSSNAKMYGRMISGRSTQVVQRADRNRYGQGHGVKMGPTNGNNQPPRRYPNLHFNHWCARDQRGCYPPLMHGYAGVKLAKPHHHHAMRGRYY